MNERIKELARKANMVEVEYSPGFPDIRYPKNFEKFAELLIEECILIARKAENEDEVYAWFAISNHFGVKE